MPQKPVIRAAGIIIYASFQNQIKFLLLKSSDSSSHWTPPKGRLNSGEDNTAAAKRETLEESGLDETAYCFEEGYSETLYYRVKDKDKECTYFLAKLKDPNTPIKISPEHSEYQWITESEIDGYTDKESLRQMLKKAYKYLNDKQSSTL